MRIVRVTLSVISLALFVSLGFAGAAKDQDYAGTWVGNYTSENGGAGAVRYTLSKDAKGIWHGTVKYGGADGEERTAELRSLHIEGGKFQAKLDGPDGDTEVALTGEFKGKDLEGTYAVMQKGSGTPTEKGSWKTTKSSTAP